MNWRLYLHRHPRLVVLPFIVLIFLGMMTALFHTSPPACTICRYQHQQTYLMYTNASTTYNIALVADKDKASKNENQWESILYNAVLHRDAHGKYSVDFKTQTIIKSKLNEEGRGMELSDLTFFNGKLYTFDDRTGIVFEVDREEEKVIARHILADGNGRSSKGFKCEWGAVKDGVLYVGGLGKEWTNSEGKIVSRDPQWVKTIDTEGRVEHHSWVHVYESLRTATGMEAPGYLIHEAVQFNPANRRWYFLPRRASTEAYNDQDDERRGANIMISTNEQFADVIVTRVGPQIPTHGFSSFAFVPFRENEVVALKTEEVEGKIASYITVFTLKGDILLPETEVGDVKYEGVEFV